MLLCLVDQCVAFLLIIQIMGSVVNCVVFISVLFILWQIPHSFKACLCRKHVVPLVPVVFGCDVAFSIVTGFVAYAEVSCEIPVSVCAFTSVTLMYMNYHCF